MYFPFCFLALLLSSFIEYCTMHISFFFKTYGFISWVCALSKYWAITTILFMQLLLWKQTRAVLLCLVSSEMHSQCSSNALNITSVKWLPYGCFLPLLWHEVFVKCYWIFIVSPFNSALNSCDHRNSTALAAISAWSQACLGKNNVRKNLMKCFIPVRICLFVNTHTDLTDVVLLQRTYCP